MREIPQRPLDDSKVMIVEDDQSSRHALSFLLSACGYRTQAYCCAEEAIAALDAARAPRIALVDWELPGMSGLELIALLQRLNPSILPVLITASELDRLSEALKQRAIPYLRKPVDFPSLLELLSRLQQHS